MPGAVPQTSTLALTNATLGDTLNIANKGWKQACLDDAGLAKGVNIVAGSIVYSEIGQAFDLNSLPLNISINFSMALSPSTINRFYFLNSCCLVDRRTGTSIVGPFFG